MFDQIKSDYGGVDVCINNAGLIKNAPILSGATEDWAEMLQVIITSLTHVHNIMITVCQNNSAYILLVLIR